MGNELVHAAVAPLIAKVAHQANRAYQAVIGEIASPDWEELVDCLRDSAIKGVRAVLSNSSIKPEQLHDAWMKDRQDDGWVHGPVKSVADKTHPCLVEWSNLEDAQRAKDRLFLAVVKALAKDLI